jgi:hypothetical protein
MATGNTHIDGEGAALQLVGIDTDDATHLFDWYEDEVYVVVDGEIEHVEALAAGQLSEWVEFVRERRGWKQCRYVDGAFTDLAETVLDDSAETPKPANRDRPLD